MAEALDCAWISMMEGAGMSRPAQSTMSSLPSVLNFHQLLLALQFSPNIVARRIVSQHTFAIALILVYCQTLPLVGFKAHSLCLQLNSCSHAAYACNQSAVCI